MRGRLHWISSDCRRDMVMVNNRTVNKFEDYSDNGNEYNNNGMYKRIAPQCLPDLKL